jgi:hypothetical protein
MSSITMQSSAAAVDGYITRNGVVETWAVITAGAGTTAAYTPGTGFSMKLQAHTDAGKWTDCVRGVFLFDPAPLPAGSVITGGSISFYPNATTKRELSSSFVLTNAPVTGYTSLVTADYARLKALPVEHGTARVTLASLTAAARFTFTLNAQALVTFNSLYQSGNKFELGLMFDWDFDAGAGPAWASGAADDITIMTVESGSTKWPILTITYRVGMGYATVNLTGTKASAGDTLTAEMWAVEVFT